MKRDVGVQLIIGALDLLALRYRGRTNTELSLRTHIELVVADPKARLSRVDGGTMVRDLNTNWTASYARRWRVGPGTLERNVATDKSLSLGGSIHFPFLQFDLLSASGQS